MSSFESCAMNSATLNRLMSPRPGQLILSAPGSCLNQRHDAQPASQHLRAPLSHVLSASARWLVGALATLAEGASSTTPVEFPAHPFTTLLLRPVARFAALNWASRGCCGTFSGTTARSQEELT
jgi:hypothetical protein